MRAEVDEGGVDKVSAHDNRDGFVLQLISSHVDNVLDFGIFGSFGLGTISDVADVEEVDESDLIILIVEVKKESVWIHLQCNRNTSVILFQRKHH